MFVNRNASTSSDRDWIIFTVTLSVDFILAQKADINKHLGQLSNH